MELINKTNQVQSVELVDGSCISCMPNKSINIKDGTIRNREFDRALKFFKVVTKEQAVKPPINTVIEPTKVNKFDKEVIK